MYLDFLIVQGRLARQWISSFWFVEALEGSVCFFEFRFGCSAYRAVFGCLGFGDVAAYSAERALPENPTRALYENLH